MSSLSKAAELDEVHPPLHIFAKTKSSGNVEKVLDTQTPRKAPSAMEGFTPSTVNTSFMHKDDISRLSTASYDTCSIGALGKENIMKDDNSSVHVLDAAPSSGAEFGSPVPYVNAPLMDFDVTSPSDEKLGLGRKSIHSEVMRRSLGLDVDDVDDTILHRSQLMEESREYFRDHADENIGTDTESNKDSIESPSQIAENKAKTQQAIIESQREELKRYNGILKTYRQSLRDKNDSLKSMEKQIDELKQRSKSNPTDGNCNNTNTGQDPNKSTSDSPWEAVTLSALKSELRTYQQIIASLTDENNGFRSKEVSLLKKIKSLESELMDLKSNSKGPSEEDFLQLEKELFLKTEITKSVMEKINSLEMRESENQVQIAELGQGILRSEKICMKLEKENETLKKQLNTSREATLNRSVDNCRTGTDLNESHLDDSFRMNNSFRSSEEDGNTIVQESLRNELEQSKRREAQLREQLKNLCANTGSKNNIMESLSESQQEVIVYLNGEVNDLRNQLEQERMKSKTQLSNILSVEDKLEILEQENKLVTEDAISKGKLLESVRQDLSMRNGENACLRDEVAELEEKSSRVHKLETSLRNLEAEHETLKKAHRRTQSQLQTLNNTKERPSLTRKVPSSPSVRSRTSLSEPDNMSLTEVTLMTIDVDNDSSNGVEKEVELSQVAEKRTFDQDASVRKFGVLKKALKQSYEKKINELKSDLDKKEQELNKLTGDLENQRTVFQKELDMFKQMEVRRICHESEMNQELEDLKTFVKDRDDTVTILRQTISQFHGHSNDDGPAWTGVSEISNALIDGVGKSIEIIENMSFPNGIEIGKDGCSRESPSRPKNDSLNPGG